MYLIFTKTSDCGNIAVILNQLTFTWPSYVTSLSRDMLHSTKSTNLLQNQQVKIQVV